MIQNVNFLLGCRDPQPLTLVHNSNICSCLKLTDTIMSFTSYIMMSSVTPSHVHNGDCDRGIPYVARLLITFYTLVNACEITVSTSKRPTLCVC